MDWIELGYPGLFLATFLAATVLPFSSEVMFTAMLLGPFDPLLCLVIASAGNWLGGMTSYFLGRLGNWQKLKKWLRVSEGQVLRWKNQIDRFGPYTALACWLPFVGDIIAIALGFFRVKAVPVALFMFIGKAARYAVIWLAISLW